MRHATCEIPILDDQCVLGTIQMRTTKHSRVLLFLAAIIEAFMLSSATCRHMNIIVCFSASKYLLRSSSRNFLLKLSDNIVGDDISLERKIPHQPESDELESLRVEIFNQVDALVKRRADARCCQNYDLADEIRDEINLKVNIPEGYKLVLKDIPLKEGGGTRWWVEVDVTNDSSSGDGNGSNVLQLAHKALGLAVHASDLHSSGMPFEGNFEQEMSRIVKAANGALHSSCVKLQGRKAADAAFWFALAGVKDQGLFDQLAHISTNEIERFGTRTSCRSVDILDIVARIAAAGVTGNAAKNLHTAAILALEEKPKDDILGVKEILGAKHSLQLHSLSSLMWIWRFSTKQRKLKQFKKNASQHWLDGAENKRSLENVKATRINITAPGIKNWSDIFANPTQQLVVDIGCGMGISLLGIATTSSDDAPPSPELQIEWKNCNFIGADLSGLAIGYANGISSRWELSDRVHFCVASAQELVDSLASYPGPVSLAMIQFPTPFRLAVEKDLQDGSNGNSQLPTDADSGFMVTKHLLKSLSEVLQASSGKLLLQSNCEDVAVFIKNMACIELGTYSCMQTREWVGNIDKVDGRLPKRTQMWIKSGIRDRAQGPEWSSIPFIPSKGATETEIACVLNSTPVHRCLLAPHIIKSLNH